MATIPNEFQYKEKHGKWIEKESQHEDDIYDGLECSICGVWIFNTGTILKKCPECGAYMSV